MPLIGYNMQAVLFNLTLDVVIAKSMHVIPQVWRKGIIMSQVSFEGFFCIQS